MNETLLSAKWLHFTGVIKQRWGVLMNNQETQAKGHVAILTGKAKESYSRTKEAALHQVNELLETVTKKDEK